MATIDFSSVITALEQAENILVLPSSPPDGDSLGSALALYLALQKKGKKVTVVCADPVPDAYKFLPDSQSIEADYNLDHDFIVKVDVSETGFKNLQYEVKDNKVNIIITPEHGEINAEHLSIDQDASKFDLIITVDTAEVKQLGKVYSSNMDLFEKLPVVNIDHHPSNTKFGKINVVNPDKASTTLMLTELFQNYDMSLIDSDVATLLLAGLITDTGSFQNANTTPEAFDTAALLIGLGARQQEIIRHIYKTKELHTLRLWGRVLSNIQTDYDHKMVWSVVSQADFKDTNSKESDIGDIIDELLSNAPEAEVVMLFKELSDGVTHLSMRTTTDEVNASKIVQNFGGGGHRRAAGANIKDQEFGKAVEAVLAFVRQEQAGRMGGAVAPEQPAATVEQSMAAPEPQAEAEVEMAPEPVVQEEVTPSVEMPEVQITPEPVVAEVAPAEVETAPAEPEVTVTPEQPQPMATETVTETTKPQTEPEQPAEVAATEPEVEPVAQEEVTPTVDVAETPIEPVAEQQFVPEQPMIESEQPAEPYDLAPQLETDREQEMPAEEKPETPEAEPQDKQQAAPVELNAPNMADVPATNLDPVKAEIDQYPAVPTTEDKAPEQQKQPASNTEDLDQYLTSDEDKFMQDMDKFPATEEQTASTENTPEVRKEIPQTPEDTDQDQGPDIDFSDYLRRH